LHLKSHSFPLCPLRRRAIPALDLDLKFSIISPPQTSAVKAAVPKRIQSQWNRDFSPVCQQEYGASKIPYNHKKAQ